MEKPTPLRCGSFTEQLTPDILVLNVQLWVGSILAAGNLERLSATTRWTLGNSLWKSLAAPQDASISYRLRFAPALTSAAVPDDALPPLTLTEHGADWGLPLASVPMLPKIAFVRKTMDRVWVLGLDGLGYDPSTRSWQGGMTWIQAVRHGLRPYYAIPAEAADFSGAAGLALPTLDFDFYQSVEVVPTASPRLAAALDAPLSPA